MISERQWNNQIVHVDHFKGETKMSSFTATALSKKVSTEDTTMLKLKPSDYLARFFKGSGFTTRTVRNWVNQGKLKWTQSPSGGLLICVDPESNNEVNALVAFIETKRS